MTNSDLVKKFFTHPLVGWKKDESVAFDVWLDTERVPYRDLPAIDTSETEFFRWVVPEMRKHEYIFYLNSYETNLYQCIWVNSNYPATSFDAHDKSLTIAGIKAALDTLNRLPKEERGDNQK